MNMSYCRFQNTLGDLRDCLEGFNDPLSPEEERAKIALIKVCRDIVYEADLSPPQDEDDDE